MHTLDTNTLIYYYNNIPNIVDFIDGYSKKERIIVSSITELELFSYKDLKQENILKIEQSLKSFTVLPVDSVIARVAGNLRAKYSIKTPDAAIAATAILTNTILVSRNKKDFKNIRELQLKIL